MNTTIGQDIIYNQLSRPVYLGENHHLTPKQLQQKRKIKSQIDIIKKQWRYILNPPKNQLGATSDRWDALYAERDRFNSLASLWRNWMGDYTAYSTKFLSTGKPRYNRNYWQNDEVDQVKNAYSTNANLLNKAYVALFHDKGLVFDSLTQQEREFYVDDIQARIDGGQSDVWYGLERTYDKPIGTPLIDSTWEPENGTENGMDFLSPEIMKYAPYAIGGIILIALLKKR